MNNRDNFLDNIRRALGRPAGMSTELSVKVGMVPEDGDSTEAKASAVRHQAETNASELMAQLQVSAAKAGWEVACVESTFEAGVYVASLAERLGSRSILHSTHPVLDRMDLEDSMSSMGIRIDPMSIQENATESERNEQRQALRKQAISADMGITGVDYCIAETGSCVLLPRKGVSRLVSLLPPVHVAIVESGQVLPSLDELFVLNRQAFLHGNLGSYMNLITGPSRSADIEHTLVTGVHGPGEVHMVLIS